MCYWFVQYLSLLTNKMQVEIFRSYFTLTTGELVLFDPIDDKCTKVE